MSARTDRLLKIFFVGALFLFIVAPLAASAASNNPFGGLVVRRMYCPCSNNWLIFLRPPKSDLPKVLSFDLGSILYAFFKLNPGEEVLGTWESYSQCWVPTSHGCRPVQLGGRATFPRIFMVGTSGGQIETDPADERKPECSDGRDNDGDGQTDYPNDPGCTSAEDDSEGDRQCSDSKDNDGDGKIDYPDDKGCLSREDNSETNELCACNCADGKSEEETRAELRAGGVEINKGPCSRDSDNPCESAPTGTNSNGEPKFECTDVRCLPQVAVDGIIEMKRRVGGGCPVVVTGGTEPGHSSHGQCRPVADLRWGTACLDNYIMSNTVAPVNHLTWGDQYVLDLDVGRTRFVDEQRPKVTRHWHVTFDGARIVHQPNQCQAKQYTAANEGWANSPYPDSKGNMTVGVGHKIVPGDGTNRTLTDAEVQELYEQDYEEAGREARNSAANHGVVFEELSPARQQVLTDMSFNMGARTSETDGLDSFDDMWTAIDNDNWDAAGDEIMDSDYGRGVTRERAERNAEMMRENNTDAAQGQIEGNAAAGKVDCSS